MENYEIIKCTSGRFDKKTLIVDDKIKQYQLISHGWIFKALC